jgi:hypothetical protein
MRDKKCIKPFLAELEKEWSKVPDWRFGQLIVNVFGTCTKDPFFYEEEEMLELFKAFFAPKH